MSTDDKEAKELVDLEIEAQEALHKVADAAIAAVPILVKLKRAQFRHTDDKLRAFVLGTEDPEGQVNVAVNTMLANAVRGIVL